MSASPTFLQALALFAAAAFFCRAGGFALMRFVPITPRLEAALRAIPLGVMIGILAPVAVRGGAPELAGLAAVGLVLRLTGSDIAASFAGIGAVAALRAFGL